MRKWFKYYLEELPGGSGRIIEVGRDKNYKEHSKAMGDYARNAGYKSRQDFFKTYFYDYQLRRFVFYHQFLEKRLGKDEKILSLASGRCANELLLGCQGFDITCSDLEPTQPELTKKLFNFHKFIRLNVLEDEIPTGFDTLFCIGLIYLFDDVQLLKFFKNVSRSLRTGGRLLLDSAGSPDNFYGTVIHDYWLPFETILLLCLQPNKHYTIIKKHHGYRRSDKEIIDAAKKCDLVISRQQNYAFTIEFRRSVIFNKLIKKNSPIEKLFNPFGKFIPYIRMFEFVKI